MASAEGFAFGQPQEDRGVEKRQKLVYPPEGISRHLTRFFLWYIMPKQNNILFHNSLFP